MKFILNINTRIVYEYSTEGIRGAVNILYRDIKKVFSESDEAENRIVLLWEEGLEPEQFVLDVGDALAVRAGDELGFIYGLLYISEHFLGIRPFWFWMDQKIEKRKSAEVPYGQYISPKPKVRYRGWFINDEVLIMKWKIRGDETEPWRMVLEALLRCGGNMVIPGTDKNSKKYMRLASDMGLWLTHHHIEPLGAEMFLRAYPDEEADYEKNTDLFLKLWRDAVEKQKDKKVVWTLGFRGQGDGPFWGNIRDGRYDTSEKRGKLISEVIEKQRQIVLEYVENPVFCTNLYGEIMELYQGGFLSFDDEIIKISADNGYGKMVSRRTGNDPGRLPSLPEKPVDHGGIYYHVSFYDLQAANHITMLPNPVSFVDRELSEAMEKNVVDFWLVNCSNVRPHVYFLDAIRKKWYGQTVSDESHSSEFAREYYNRDQRIANVYRRYHKAMLPYGKEEDEHAGEQFYMDNIRMLIHGLINRQMEGVPPLYWLTGQKTLKEQIGCYTKLCRGNEENIGALYEDCSLISSSLAGDVKKLFDATIFLHVSIHFYCTRAAVLFGEACKRFFADNMKQAFMLAGQSAEMFDKANGCLVASEYGVWKGFYFNECFADIKHSAYMVRKFMGIVREAGDDIYHVQWYREAVYSEEDRYITALFVTDNHMADWELYEAFKKKAENCDL